MNFKFIQALLLFSSHLCELVSGKPISSQLFEQNQFSKIFKNVISAWGNALRAGSGGIMGMSDEEYFSILQEQANLHNEQEQEEDFLQKGLTTTTTTTLGFPLTNNHDWIKDDYNFLADYEADLLPVVKSGFSSDKVALKSFDKAYNLKKKRVNEQVKKVLELKLQLDKRVVGMYPELVYGRSRDSIVVNKEREKRHFEFRVDYNDNVYAQAEYQNWKPVEEMLDFEKVAKSVDDNQQVSVLFDDTYEYDPPTAFMKILTCGPVSGLKYGFKAGEYTGKGVNSLVRYAGKEDVIEPIAVMSAGALLGAASGTAVAVPVSLVVGTIKSAFICMESNLGNGTAFFIGLAITTSVSLGPVAGGFGGAVAGFRMCTPENLPKDYYNVLVHRIQQRAKTKFKHILTRAFGGTKAKKENTSIGGFSDIVDKIPSLPFDFPYLSATLEEFVEGRDEILCTGDILQIPLTRDKHVERIIKVFVAPKDKEFGFESIEVATPVIKAKSGSDDDDKPSTVVSETLYWLYTWRRISTGKEESLILKYNYTTSASVESPSLLSLSLSNNSDVFPLRVVGLDDTRIDFNENEVVDITKLQLDNQCFKKQKTLKFDWNYQV